MSDRSLSVVIAFRRGWQWPLREGDLVKVYQAEGMIEIPARLILDLIAHYLTGIRLQAAMRHDLRDAPPRLPAARGRRLRNHR